MKYSIEDIIEIICTFIGFLCLVMAFVNITNPKLLLFLILAWCVAGIQVLLLKIFHKEPTIEELRMLLDELKELEKSSKDC